jgi:hypothetical protein
LEILKNFQYFLFAAGKGEAASLGLGQFKPFVCCARRLNPF